MIDQSRIDAATKSKVGIDSAARGKSRKIMAQIMVDCLHLHEEFYKWLPSIFPQLGDLTIERATKSDKYHPHGHECTDECTHSAASKAVDFTQQEANGINNFFRSHYPKEWAQMNQYSHDWLDRLMKNNLPGQGAPFSKAYWEMLQQGSTFGYQSALADKNRPNPALPPMPFVVNAGEDFIKKIYADGYGLVSSQITLGVIVPAMDAINSGLQSGKSWTEITDDLHSQFQGKQYHWGRLVRTEMAMAANAGTMAQARELKEPSAVIKWSTSMGGKACPICLGRNGLLYSLDSEIANGSAHPQCMCVRVITFLKRNSTAVVN